MSNFAQVCDFEYDDYVAGTQLNIEWNTTGALYEAGYDSFRAENLDYHAEIAYYSDTDETYAKFEIVLKRKMSRVAFETIGPTCMLVLISSVSRLVLY